MIAMYIFFTIQRERLAIVFNDTPISQEIEILLYMCYFVNFFFLDEFTDYLKTNENLI